MEGIAIEPTFWQGFWAAVPALALAVIGYLSLRYKASAENVRGLEAVIAVLHKRVEILEADYGVCQEERRKSSEENTRLAEQKAKVELQLIEAKLRLQAAQMAHATETKIDDAATELRVNTEMTSQTKDAVQELAEKVEKIIPPEGK